jgi:phenylpropionate dioxygenase-like ring-hydroxylating dioxygenase large terminal subunit
MNPVANPIADGYHLPVEAYTSTAWFERERKELFDQTWQFVGMSDDLVKEGDFVTSDVGASGLVILRGTDGTLKAFHNLCRHRGARLLEGTGNVGRELRCFYHSWAYSLEGDLKRVPQRDQFPDIDLACLGLHRANVATWKGMMFVHADPDAEPFDAWLSDFPAAMGPYNPLELAEAGREVFEVKANWKLFAENHIDGYHLWHLHRTSVVGFNHAQQTWRPIGRHWTFREPAQKPGTSPTANQGLPAIDGLTPDWYGSTVHLLFPNLGVATGAEYWLTLHMLPSAADRTRVEVRIRTMPLDTITKTKVFAKSVAKATRSTMKAKHGCSRIDCMAPPPPKRLTTGCDQHRSPTRTVGRPKPSNEPCNRHISPSAPWLATTKQPFRSSNATSPHSFPARSRRDLVR